MKKSGAFSTVHYIKKPRDGEMRRSLSPARVRPNTRSLKDFGAIPNRLVAGNRQG